MTSVKDSYLEQPPLMTTLDLQGRAEPAGAGASKENIRLAEAIRNGDESAFGILVERHQSALLRLAMAFVPNRDVAEEVVQETWLAVLEGLHRFEGRSTLATWIFRILINLAKTRGVRESRSVPFSPLERSEEDPDKPAVDPARFRSTSYWVDHGASPPAAWDDNTPERILLSKESLSRIEKAIETLPTTQRRVLIMRDVDGLGSEEVCSILKISETNQRVLLHRARLKARRELELYLNGGPRAGRSGSRKL